MKRIIPIVIILLSILATAQAQKSSPSQAVITFYRLLREKKYVEGFHYSIYRDAIEGLTPAELQDLEPDFARTFAQIPEKIEVKGEQIKGNSAIVTLQFEGEEKPQEVSLIRKGDEWLVGDQESLAVVQKQGRAYFFNTRMDVNESEAHLMLVRIISAEVLYANSFAGKNASLAELIRLQALPQEMLDGEAGGYQYQLIVAADEKSFTVTATPMAYGKSGRLSFYADIHGVRAAELKGQVASKSAPPYQPK
jgi:hypothetical protein